MDSETKTKIYSLRRAVEGARSAAQSNALFHAKQEIEYRQNRLICWAKSSNGQADTLKDRILKRQISEAKAEAYAEVLRLIETCFGP